jgi:ADP-ribosylglycohydrolase
VSDGPDIASRFRGAVLGHAIGDAMGAPVEFLSAREIRLRYGQLGVDDFQPWEGHPKGAWTDDTQLMRATAVGLLRAFNCEAQETRHCDPAEFVYARYLEWRTTQEFESERRGPGTTCLEALASGEMGTSDDPINDSKGAGGIMRVTPVGLAYLPDGAFELGIELAALTHGHPTGWLAAGFFAAVLSRVVRGRDLLSAIRETRELLIAYDDFDETLEAADLAIELFIADETIDEGIERLGQGWIAEEALGIALFCALNFPTDFAEGLLAAVNHDGDSDTTGCLTGALLGAAMGVEAIPGSWVSRVEDSRALGTLADDLRAAFIEGVAPPADVYPPT